LDHPETDHDQEAASENADIEELDDLRVAATTTMKNHSGRRWRSRHRKMVTVRLMAVTWNDAAKERWIGSALKVATI
jgi:hypothetical protein